MPSRTPAMPEAALQKAVTDICGLLGIWWYHVGDSRRDRPGFPDLVLIGRTTIFRELKTETGTVTTEQAEVGARLQRSGQSWAVWRPRDLHSGRVLAELEAIR
jgi:hypothetical protein